jgi:adenylate cyclase class IV
MEEFEIKFLEVDVPELEKKLLAIGAKKTGEYYYSTALFDYPDFRMDKDHAWLKLRTDGKETTLSYK